jgi:hypothetical protein
MEGPTLVPTGSCSWRRQPIPRGGPHTTFIVHLQVLLNGAGDSYRLSGTRCPALTPNTYHLIVAIAGRRPARPFGTATFTVRR